MEPVRVDVRAGSCTSTIWIGDGISARLSGFLDAARLGARRFLVSSQVVWKLHGPALEPAATGNVTLIPDGERYKNLQTVARIYESLIRARADRGSALIAVGGGVVGDVAGFAAATYLRGIALAHVPTTLLAQVDSSIGGKVGVNHQLGKNLIGSFHQPAIVVTDPRLLGTLKRREFRSGLYEVVKYGMIASRDLFERVMRDTKALFARDPAVLMPVIIESCRIKADVVSADERESGLRRVLNFGHTVSHALEAITRHRRLRHGEAIAYGMLAAADLAVARGALNDPEPQALARPPTKPGPLSAGTAPPPPRVTRAGRHTTKIAHARPPFVISI